MAKSIKANFNPLWLVIVGLIFYILMRPKAAPAVTTIVERVASNNDKTTPTPTTPKTPVVSNVKPDWVSKFGASRTNASHETSLYLRVSKGVTVTVQRIGSGAQPDGLGWSADVYRTPEIDPYHEDYGLVLRLNPTVNGTGGILAGVPYRFNIKDSDGNIFYLDYTFPNANLPITDLLAAPVPETPGNGEQPQEPQQPQQPTETRTKPAWLEKLAFSRTAVSHETSAYLKTTVPITFGVRRVGAGEQPSGAGWSANVLRGTEVDPWHPNWGQVVRFNPLKLNEGGILAGVPYEFLAFNPATNELYVYPYAFGNNDLAITDVLGVITEPEPEPEGPVVTPVETGGRPAVNFATQMLEASTELMKLVPTYNQSTGKVTFRDTATPDIPAGYRKIYFINDRNKATINGPVFAGSFPNLAFSPGEWLSVCMFITKSETGEDLDKVGQDTSWILPHTYGRAQTVIRVGNS